jgi:hypothetical protein
VREPAAVTRLEATVNRYWRQILVLSAVSLLLTAGCEDRDPTELEVGRLSIDPVVFDNAYGDGVYFQPFFETHYLAASIDSVYAYDASRLGGVGFAPDGARSWKINVPPIGSALGPYSGGVLTPAVGRDLTDYNALTFWVRSNAEGAQLNVAGFGNDNTGTSLFETSRGAIPLTREWTYHIVPIPDPSRFINERGLFLFAEAAEEAFPDGYDIWFDEIRFDTVDGIDLLLTQLSGQSSIVRRYFTGMRIAPGGGTSIYTYEGVNLRVDHSARFYDFTVSDPGVASVNEIGDISVTGTGPATITASLLETAARGAIRMEGYPPPTSGPARPTLPASSVISLFSDAYDDRPVDTWKADWDGVTTVYEEYSVGGDAAKLYYNMNYFGIEFLSRPVNASQMTHFHLDVYAVAGTQFEVKLQSILPGGTELETVVFLNAESTPAFQPGGWSSFEIPLSDFDLPEGWDWSRVSRLILGASADVQLILVDNVYWHK